MISGARQGKSSWLRRMVAASVARNLGVFVIPGPEIARAHGLNLEAAGLHEVASPRHASVLLVTGDIPAALREAAAVIYAQMVRPRALFVLGTQALSPLPDADVMASLSQQSLVQGAQQLRSLIAGCAFLPDVADFDAAVLRVSIEYTCQMHPEVIRDEPGSCPKCGMSLVPREAQAGPKHVHPDRQKADAGTNKQADHSHHHGHGSTDHGGTDHGGTDHGGTDHGGMDHGGMDHGGMDHGGMDHGGMDHGGMDHGGMDHGGMDHGGMDHGGMDHGGMAFMSMIEVTRDLPRSSDGLPMEWIDVPFGPFFPGLPGGLLLRLTLDGDTVAGSVSRSLTENADLLRHSSMEAAGFVDQLAGMDPLAPVAYRLLACRALEDAAGTEVDTNTANARVGALERERIASHLGWLALFAHQTGFHWLMQQASSLQLMIQHADFKPAVGLGPALRSFIRRLQRTPLLESRMAGIGRLERDTALRGPVARAAGIAEDARNTDPAYTALGFKTVTREAGDTLARLQVRLDEIIHSLELIAAAGAIESPAPVAIDAASGTGEAMVETPRGLARLQVTLESGQVTAAQLETPSTLHLGLVDPLTGQQALGDALMAVCSLDLSPWEVRQ